MNNKGFTLIELLGVIILISILTLLVLPNIINSVRDTSDDVDDLTLRLIYDAADLYISNNSSDFPKINGKMYGISLKDLSDEGLLSSPIKLSDNIDLINSKSVQVKYEDGFKYELKDSSEIIDSSSICKKREKSLDIGSEITCGLGDDSQTFNVINIDGDNIMMFAQKNITLDNIPTQSSSAGAIKFSSKPYWLDNSYPYSISPNYLDNKFVYDKNSVFYEYIENYKKYLKDKLYLDVLDATILSKEQFDSVKNSSWYNPTYFCLGTVLEPESYCQISDTVCGYQPDRNYTTGESCTEAGYKWEANTCLYYTCYDKYNCNIESSIYTSYENETMQFKAVKLDVSYYPTLEDYNYETYTCGIRPLITISKSSIK
ncbi:MAG: prepilin-type N-terminal cleavage/methylation domain-containing protein [Bacilli bacterium]|nr:prepilin-type N-terminal cleavage/methylation domain-containing protein [Bacilli bacterium]